MSYPVRAVSRPRCLNGRSNGRLDDVLVSTPVLGVEWPCRLVEPAARAWRALSAAAAQAGHKLKPSGQFDSYRPYAAQERIFRQRYRPVYKRGASYRVWQGQRWYHWYGAAAAVPGTSNHGWGLAVDTGEENDGDAGTERLDSGTLNWLLQNEERFGFSHEIQSEPWHIRYFAGDQIPQAVLAYERNRPPTGVTNQEDDMPTVIVKAVRTNPDKPGQGYVMDTFGGLHAFGGAPGIKGPYWKPDGGISPAIDFDIYDWSTGKGYLLDALGRLHPINGAPAVKDSPNWPNAFIPPGAPN